MGVALVVGLALNKILMMIQPHALQQVDLPSEAGVVVEVAAAMSDSLDGLPASHPSTGADEA